GAVSQRLGLPGNPDAAEAVMIFRDGEVARLTGARVHLAHVSSRRGLEVATWLKASGAPVTVEVTPQHLTLTDESLAGFDPVYKVAPPLRTADDVAALRAALAGGAVDSIGTDHAPHTLAEKQQDMLSAPFGIANLEVAFPLLYTRLVAAGELPLERLLWLLQDGPARVMGWPAPRLDPGPPADVPALALETGRAGGGARFRGKPKHTPGEGEALGGWPVATPVAGRPVHLAG